MNQSPIDHIFAHTTVSPQAVRRYILGDPGYLRSAIETGSDPHHQTVSNHADYFEFHLRRFLVGRPKTLHRVFYEVRVFIAFDELQARHYLPLIMQQMNERLLANEWYEFMPRYEKARRQLKRQFGF